MTRALLLLALLCAGGCAAPLEKGDVPVLLVPRAPGDHPADPEEPVAQAAYSAQRYDQAADLYYLLSQRVTDARLRADFLLYSAEAALGERDHHAAYQRYTRLLKLYPTTEHYDHAVNREFLLGRLFAEGKVLKPSWLFALDMTDRDFGIKALERFQRERERHPLADDALHYAAVGYEASNEPGLAIDTWTKLGRLYPQSEWAETAEYRTALATLRLSDGVVYDKGPLESGLERLEAYLRDHPKGDHAAEAQQKVAALREQLAGQLLVAARYYQRKDRPYAARLYLNAIQRDYPKTDAAREAKTLAAAIPRTSPPAQKAPPSLLEGETGVNEDRLRLAPAPVDDTW
ncbi:MAG: outer membrane protein assembly factor BamD [Planctomycetota bacterium]